MLNIAIETMAHHDTALPLPRYETMGAAGADLRASFANKGEQSLAPGERALIPTGLKMAIPVGYEAQIRPRSGLAFKQGITVANAPGTIDSDYRGEVMILLINLGAEAVTIAHGDRVAQMVVAPVTQAHFALGALDGTARGEGGFGSTGVAT